MSENGPFQNGNKVADSSSTGSSSDGSCVELKIPDESKDENKRVSIPVVAVKLCICFITGIFFGFALEKGRVFEPKSIRHQMVFESFIMLKMFLAATGTGLMVFSLLSAVPATKPYFAAVSDEFVSCFKEKGILTSIIGPFVLGIGMTLSGACPGMVLAQVGAWTTNSIFTLLGCLFGALTYGLIGPFISKISRPKKCPENHQVHSTFKWPFFAVALPLGLLIGVVVVILEIYWKWDTDLRDLYRNKTLHEEDNIFLAVAWRPSVSGVIIGLLQLPIVFAVKDTLGGSSSYVTVVSQWLVTKKLQETFPYLENKRTGLGNWWQVLYVSGAILGGAISAFLSNTIATAHGPSIPTALLGGILMLWGARLAAGCTSGHGLSGLGLLAWLSFLAVPCMFAGAIGTGFAMKTAGVLDDYKRQTASQEPSTKASLLLAFKLAKASKPFSEGEFLKECMVETAGLLCPESKGKFEQISLSRRTVTRRVELIDEDIASKLNKKAESFKFYSLALDESNDIKDTAQLLIFIRGISDSFDITEEFLTMESMKGKTRGEDLYNQVSAVIERMKLPWSKRANVTTDGSPNLTGKNVGLLNRLQEKVKEENPDQDVIFLHCIIHQEVLCKSILQLNHVMNPVVKLVNFIRARGLQHRQFIAFLEETDADHQDLLYHSRVRWLSLGKVFQRVWELKEEITAFLELMGRSDEFSELSDMNWLCDFAFAVDILSHMNELNTKLQGKDQFVHDMYTNVRAFKSKLTLFSRQISNKSFTHFPILAMQKEATRNAQKYSKSLDDLHEEFCRRFCDFEKIEKSLQLVSCPLSRDPETASQELQLELIDLQSDSVLKEKFNSLKLNDFYASLNEATFPNLRRMAQKMLTLFGSTYVCEQTFSVMNINKARHRSKFTDQHLGSILRIATTNITPDIDALAKKGDQQHCSH